MNVLLEAKDDDFGVVVRPLAHSEVQVTVDFLSCKKPHMMDLKTRGRCESAQTQSAAKTLVEMLPAPV